MTARSDDRVALEAELTRADNRRLHIRPLRRCEDDASRAFYARLSPRTRYLRFFSPMPFLPDAVLRLLTSVDYRRNVSLVAEDGAGTGEIVALASFGATDDDCGEVALVVRDDWQRQRVETALADRVLRAAEDLGFCRLVVHVTSDNLAIRKLLTRVGDVETAAVAAQLAVVYRYLPDDAGSEALFERALSVLDATLGADHPQTAIVRSQLAILDQRMGQRAKAEALIHQPLGAIEQALGVENR